MRKTELIYLALILAAWAFVSQMDFDEQNNVDSVSAPAYNESSSTKTGDCK